VLLAEGLYKGERVGDGFKADVIAAEQSVKISVQRYYTNVAHAMSSCNDGGTAVRWPRSIASDMRRIRCTIPRGGPVQAA